MVWVFWSYDHYKKGHFMVYFRCATPSVVENGPEQNSCLVLWAPTLSLHETIFHTAGCEIILVSLGREPPMQKSINSWASTIHTWNERMWWKKEKEYDREEREKYSERGKEGEANRQEDTAKEEKNKNWTGRAKERNKKEKRQMNAEEQGECLEGPSMSLVWTPDRFSTGRHSHRKIKILWLLSHAHRNMHTSYDRH